MLTDWISAIEGWVPTLAGSVWVYFALALFATIDGFFPPIPSESVVIALASLSVAQGQPNLLLIGVAGAIGAFCGDQIAYTIGSKVNVRNMRLFRTDKGEKALEWAEHALTNRGSSFILAARYIPIGRVAVNMSAGALGYPRKRFVGLTALAAVTWACYGTLIGVGAGVWLHNHPVLAVVVGIAVGSLVGLAIDWVLRKWTSIGASTAKSGSASTVAGAVGSAPTTGNASGTDAIAEVAGVIDGPSASLSPASESRPDVTDPHPPSAPAQH